MRPETITSVLGTVLPVTYTYGDGSFDCPFCRYAVKSPGTVCQSPGCVANPAMPVEAAQRMVAKADEERKEKEQRERNHRWAMERIQEGNRARAEATAKAEREATDKGQCIACLRRSGYRKTVKHRGECPAK